MRFSERASLTNPTKQTLPRPVDVIVTVLLPWLIFSLIVSLLVFAYEDYGPIVWALVVVCLLLSLLFVTTGVAVKRPLQVALGLLVLTSVGVSIPVGFCIESEFMVDFWRVDNGASYKQVSASDPAVARSDAAVLEFVAGTSVDAKSSVGYMKRGTVYCVAPVVGAAASDAGPGYWAAGTDCCEQRGGFSCGDVKDPHALTGVAIPDEEGHFATAVRAAVSTHGLTEPSGKIIFLDWTASGPKYKEGLWTNAALFVMVSSTVHFGISACGGIFAARAKL
ncbi:unnamed protein product [Prorocentrum cordatum]|uniref:Uncharacterized protein n=1 Tax=Prorocentrum cordatum TaxID=2364126 RepID=A0ABN9WZB8_9DINO|nr:unnamed protein product [Polarella glacialis]|mmetsp:Transcript_55248/g.143735  ORF Transcript_55248/g.143735 Transcript_55248/m.143735 type:complete len:279 (-) Transcript_55248:141-977(-)